MYLVSFKVIWNNVPKNSNLNATNVQDAIDELYSRNINLEISGMTTKVLYNNSQYDSTSRSFKYSITQDDIDSYDYFIIGSSNSPSTTIGSTRVQLHSGFLSLGGSRIWLAKTTDCTAGQYVSASGTYYTGVFVIGIKLSTN